MIARYLAAGIAGLIIPAIVAASEPPIVELVPAPPLEIAVPEYPDGAQALPPPDYPQPPAHVAERFVREGIIYDGFRTGELVRLQFARTKWLEENVGRHGWPNENNSTRAGAGNAALMVWQGDHDPAFQLRMLRVMEPLVATGEMEGWEFAEVYDGVMLELTGKQRYATHTICADGLRGPQILEDPARLNQWRSEMDMEPIEDYSAFIEAACQL